MTRHVLDQPWAAEFVKTRLGADGQLRQGLPLRRALLQIALDSGELWTWGTEGVTVSAEDLKDGLPSGITNALMREQLKLFVIDYLSRPGRIGLIEDHDSSASESWPADRSVPDTRVACGEYLYWYIARPERRLVEAVLQWGLGLYKCLALTVPEADWSLNPPISITEATIAALAASVDHFVVDAFDFDGFVIWSRNRASE